MSCSSNQRRKIGSRLCILCVSECLIWMRTVLFDQLWNVSNSGKLECGPFMRRNYREKRYVEIRNNNNYGHNFHKCMISFDIICFSRCDSDVFKAYPTHINLLGVIEFGILPTIANRARKRENREKEAKHCITFFLFLSFISCCLSNKLTKWFVIVVSNQFDTHDMSLITICGWK